MLRRGYKGTNDLWRYHPLTRTIPDKRKSGVRQRKGICRTRSPVVRQAGGTHGKRIEGASPTGLARAGWPAYHQASGSQKQHNLEDFVTATGYARTYAQWLLSHTEEIFTTPVILRRRYGPEVFAAVLVAWILV